MKRDAIELTSENFTFAAGGVTVDLVKQNNQLLRCHNVVTSASHDLALAWHTLYLARAPRSSLLSLDVTLHTPSTGLISFRSSVTGRDT
jgi:hypothetical protein